MSIVLCSESALRFWVDHKNLLRKDKREYVPYSKSFLPSRAKVDEVRAYLEERELHVLTSSDDRRHIDNLVPHVIAAQLPHNSLIRVSKDLVVCSPELAFVQMASRLDLIQTIKLGYALCGTGFGGTVSKAHLEGFAQHAAGIHGIKNARRALQFVLENSASPRETEMAMLLCLPRRLGGYGLPEPILNFEVELSKEERRVTGKSSLRLDMYWKRAKLDLEYDSNEHHSGIGRLTADSCRRTALASRGIEVISVTNAQIRDMEGFDAIARIAARRMGHRMRPLTGERAVRMVSLRWDLFDALPISLPDWGAFYGEPGVR